MAKRFQNKKLNKDDHKEVKQAADGVKKSLGVLGVVVMALVHGKGLTQRRFTGRHSAKYGANSQIWCVRPLFSKPRKAL